MSGIAGNVLLDIEYQRKDGITSFTSSSGSKGQVVVKADSLEDLIQVVSALAAHQSVQKLSGMLFCQHLGRLETVFTVSDYGHSSSIRRNSSGQLVAHFSELLRKSSAASAAPAIPVRCVLQEETPSFGGLNEHSLSQAINALYEGADNLECSLEFGNSPRNGTPPAASGGEVANYHNLGGAQPPVESSAPFPWLAGACLGRGASGIVSRAMNIQSGELFALKEILLDQIDVSCCGSSWVAQLCREVSILSSVRHPNIVAYFGAEIAPGNRVVRIFTEFVSGGSIETQIDQFRQLPYPVVRSYTKQLLSALCHLHENGILHRDIKGGNVLVSANGTVKLADFGCSKSTETIQARSKNKTSLKGTVLWMAPEVLESEEYTVAGDLWAVGCTMIQMLTGSPPWPEAHNMNPIAAVFAIAQKKSPPPIARDGLPSDILAALDKLLSIDPAGRGSARGVLDLLD